jgi:spermidine/putrescine transport system permease protein
MNWIPRLRVMFMRSEALRGYTLLSPTLIVMAFSMCVPLGIMVAMSFWTQHAFEFDTAFSLSNYDEAISAPVYQALLIRSLVISGTCAIATVLISYPMAYYVAFHVHRRKLLWIILMTLPFWTSYLLRVFAWKVILGYNGAINSGLKALGLIDQPLEFLLYSPTAVVITLAHAWAAFAILPIYVSLEKIDRSLLEAAADLGDGPVRRFLRVTLPLSLPGVIAAMLLIFIPTVGDYVTPTLVGGPDGIMMANIIQAQFGKVNNWPMGAALAVSMMITVTVIAVVYMWVTRKAVERIA